MPALSVAPQVRGGVRRRRSSLSSRFRGGFRSRLWSRTGRWRTGWRTTVSVCVAVWVCRTSGSSSGGSRRRLVHFLSICRVGAATRFSVNPLHRPGNGCMPLCAGAAYAYGVARLCKPETIGSIPIRSIPHLQGFRDRRAAIGHRARRPCPLLVHLPGQEAAFLAVARFLFSRSKRGVQGTVEPVASSI